jgi:hypothetical protein
MAWRMIPEMAERKITRTNKETGVCDPGPRGSHANGLTLAPPGRGYRAGLSCNSGNVYRLMPQFGQAGADSGEFSWAVVGELWQI